MKPFSEVALFEQGNSLDPFYATGSMESLGEIPGSLSGPLSSKEQIRLSFSVKNPVRMLPKSSSLYYFSPVNGQWVIPKNALPDHAGPFDKVAFRTPFPNFSSSIFIEDQIGFDCFGNPLISGSLNKRRVNDAPSGREKTSFGSINSPTFPIIYEHELQIKYLTGDYPKSIQRNPDYDASNDDVFTISVDHPFLIEKATFEIPLCLGPGWFKDRTVCCPAHGATESYLFTGSTWDKVYGDLPTGYRVPVVFYNEGGPGITVSLFAQKKYKDGYIRDLIMNELIVPLDDTIITGSNFEFYQSVDGYANYFALSGLGSSSGSADITKVIPTNGLYYTGSVLINGTSTVSNGVKIYRPLSTNLKGFINLITTKKIPLLGREIGTDYIFGIDAFGRGMTGFSPSGGSIFGGEYITSQNKLDSNLMYENPLYLPNISDSEFLDLTSKFDALCTPPETRGSAEINFVINLSGKKSSPYLINPGEKLILAVSKHRPAYRHYSSDIYATDNYSVGVGHLLSSSYFHDVPNGHDVQLMTGTINITLYGSYIRAGSEYTP